MKIKQKSPDQLGFKDFFGTAARLCVDTGSDACVSVDTADTGGL